ncbi:AI-2E family transporter [Pseudoxanthomonas daejeonensis]|uniref:AI-2E family transporter n=1 Tax=Pseudoxanthomonas daejeonensis TaxID=266062 RepID=UPI001F542F88|nr:AI-2E family transporter [Pseudoxanthomonas daejeonensis]UNK58805.1 AI-2E family transporter [Pseudoxanthomonas daejeonensis]
MNERFRALVYGTVFTVLLGWMLYIGRDILVPIVFSVMAVYVILGATRLLARIPVIGPALPVQALYALATLVMLAALALLGWLAMDSVDQLLAQVPHYQAQLVSMVQQGAALLGVESAPSWEGIRTAVLAQVNLQRLAGSTLGWVASMIGGLTVVGLYVAFLMIERRHFDAKLDALSPGPQRGARVRRIVGDINRRIGTYLALKTLLSILLGFVSWIVLAAMGVELAPFWALVIGLLNYVPYIGSVLGVALPVLFALLQFGDLKAALVLAGALSVVQFLNGNLLDPYLMGSSLNLSPFVILVCLTVWTALWGVPGAFLAVPVTASLVMVLAEFQGSRPIAVLLSKKGEV